MHIPFWNGFLCHICLCNVLYVTYLFISIIKFIKFYFFIYCCVYIYVVFLNYVLNYIDDTITDSHVSKKLKEYIKVDTRGEKRTGYFYRLHWSLTVLPTFPCAQVTNKEYKWHTCIKKDWLLQLSLRVTIDYAS